MVMDLDPISYWRVQELVGDTAADEMLTQDGEYHNGILRGQDGALSLRCNDNVAIYFDGHDDYLSIEHNDEFELLNGTIQFWFKDSGTITDGAMFSKDSQGFDDGGHVTISTRPDTEKLRVRLQDDQDNFEVFSDEAIVLNTWYMMTFTFGAEGMKLYMNDALVDTNPYDGGLLGNMEPLALGANTWMSGDGTIHELEDHWSGFMDEIVIYDSVLTQQQIEDLYNFGANCVPEPATMALLALGGILLRKRR